MISLFLFPALCLYHFYPYLKKDERVIKVVIGTGFNPKLKNTMQFDTAFPFNTKSKRELLTIHLTGIDNEDRTKLDFFRLQMRDIIKEKDTLHGVHLVFADNVNYGRFIESLTICEEEGIISKSMIGNNIWAFYRHSDKHRLKKMKEAREKTKEQNRFRKAERYKYKMPLGDILSKNLKVWPIFIIILLLGFLSAKKVKD